jgi:peroxiredoxin
MTIPRIGERARSFRLPSARGTEVGLDDFLGRNAVVLWFTKGMACPFCRQQMSQLARGYPQIREQRGEVLEVTSTSPARAQFYGRRFTLPFPYLCDPDYRVRNAWGLGKRAHGPGYYAKAVIKGVTAPLPPNDFGAFKPAMSELPGVFADDDMGVFIVDRAGIVRYALTGSYFTGTGIHALPAADEIMRELARCAAAA